MEAEDEFLYYVMPYVERESLRDRLEREKQLPLDDALRITREVADALTFAHTHGIIHRDIKPENILLSAGHARVADFGIARAIAAAGGETLTQTGMTVGTPAYMSPEQAAGAQDLDGRSDLYQLGCVLYEMLAGQPPFTGPTVESVVHQHLTADALPVTQFRPRVPSDVAAALDRALAKTPADRFATATEFADRLAEAVAPAAAAPASAHPRSTFAATLVLVGVVSIGAVIWVVQSGAPAAPVTRSLHQLTISAELEEYPSLSPDGGRVVFTRDVGGVRQLVLRRIETGDEQQLTLSEYDHIQPVWDPNGAAVYYVRAREARTRLEPTDVFAVFTGGDIWRHEVATGAQERLVTDAFNPAVAPDGRHIAFDASRGGTRRLWIADERGRNARQVSFDSSEAVTHVDPDWSPDGGKLVFQHIERTTFDVGIVELGAGTLHRVTQDVFLDVNPAWSQRQATASCGPIRWPAVLRFRSSRSAMPRYASTTPSGRPTAAGSCSIG